MFILGLILAVVMGLTLGLLGGGGSILTVPILVYVMGVDPVLGTAYSLFVVGTTAVVGGWRKHTQGLVEWKTGLTFAVPALVAVFFTRYALVPAIPEQLFTVGSLLVTKQLAIMVFFAIIMVLAAGSMIRPIKKTTTERKPLNLPVIILEGLVVGTITGVVGAGGGFLIVPALVLLVGMPMKKAVGTSLIIIAIKSLIGFLGDLGSGQAIDWGFLAMFTGVSLVGMFIGLYLTKFVPAGKLKTGFGWFVLVAGILIIAKELWW